MGEKGCGFKRLVHSGGHVDPGETFASCKKELFEETGIDMSEELLMPVGKYIPKRRALKFIISCATVNPDAQQTFLWTEKKKQVVNGSILTLNLTNIISF